MTTRRRVEWPFVPPDSPLWEWANAHDPRKFPEGEVAFRDGSLLLVAERWEEWDLHQDEWETPDGDHKWGGVRVVYRPYCGWFAYTTEPEPEPEPTLSWEEERRLRTEAALEEAIDELYRLRPEAVEFIMGLTRRHAPTNRKAISRACLNVSGKHGYRLDEEYLEQLLREWGQKARKALRQM